jgi:serine/threonine protein phosphatase PrpC
MEVELTQKDDFLILACDGLWDVFANQDAADFLKISMQTFGNPEKAVSDLVNEAIKLGSMDNVSVLVVFFSHQ